MNLILYLDSVVLLVLFKKGIKARTIQRGRYTPEIALQKAKDNPKDLSLILDYLSEKNIKSFRISSEISP
jgi:UV DNA damage repair endonuclease